MNLTQMLLEATRPLTLREIDERLEGMSGSPEARRKVFERAKSDLRGLGIPIEVVQLPSGDVGYTINPAALVLDVSLTEQESVALASALAMVRVEGKPPSDLAGKLGYILSGNSSAFIDLNRPELVGVMYEAAAKAKVVRFSYSGTVRNLEIYQITSRWGRWYVTGKDKARDSVRTFRVDRISGPIEIVADSQYRRPSRENKDRLLGEQAWFVDEDNLKIAKVRVDETDAKIIRSSGLASSMLAGDDGFWECEFVFSEESGLRAFFFELSSLPEIISPRELREDFCRWIEATQKRYQEEPCINWDPGSVLPAEGGVESRRQSPHMSSVDSLENAKGRFSLLTRLLPVLQSQSEMSISELALSFGIDKPHLISLLETAATCGLPPYTPDALFEIFVDVEKDKVYVDVDSKLALPRKINYIDALVFRFSASVISTYLKGESDALNSALSKLEAALIGEVDARELVSVGISSSPQLDVVRECIAKKCIVEFEYFSQSSKKIKLWELEPIQVFVRDGHFYVSARVVESKERRTFRASRILSVKEGRANIDLAEMEETEPAQPLSVSKNTEYAYLEVDKSGLRQLELIAPSYLTILDCQDDRWLVSVPVVSGKWLNTTLLKVGPHGVLVGREDLKADFRIVVTELASDCRAS
ncbi:MAG: WYL domain-containing protein [Acidimicrobiaceae bacterium]|nr:WYL domain-containing protein [Acidimicrobiaceae bacterium]